MATMTTDETTEDLTLTIEIEGERYEVEPATISEAYLGNETHGILIANLAFEAPGWGQRELAYSRTLENLGHYIQGVLAVTQASDWGKVPGTPVLALRKSFLGPIEGFISTDQKRILLFKGGHRSEVILRG